MNKKRNNKGFSLVELIVVIAIMAVLVGVLAPAYLKYVESSREKKDANNLEEVRHAVEIAISDEDVFKTVTDDMTVSISSTGVISDGSTELLEEISSVVGDSIDLVSKKYTTSGWTITIDLTDGVDVSGNWPS